MADLYEYSTPELVRLLGVRFKEYRMRCNLTQKEVAELTGLGLTTIQSLRMEQRAIFRFPLFSSC